jgi:hypothetical protein
MFVFGFALGWIWVLLGLYVRSPQSLQGFGFIVMFPATPRAPAAKTGS